MRSNEIARLFRFEAAQERFVTGEIFRRFGESKIKVFHSVDFAVQIVVC